VSAAANTDRGTRRRLIPGCPRRGWTYATSLDRKVVVRRRPRIRGAAGSGPAPTHLAALFRLLVSHAPIDPDTMAVLTDTALSGRLVSLDEGRRPINSTATPD
jgi:hypothetical protein